MGGAWKTAFFYSFARFPAEEWNKIPKATRMGDG